MEEKVNMIPALVQKQRAFFMEGGVKSVKERKRLLKNLRSVIKAKEQEIFKALEKDFSKSYFETYVSEIGLVYEEIKFFLRDLSEWTEWEPVPTPITNFKGKSFIVRAPYGVVLIVGPWNYPFQLALLPAIGAIAAGNSVIIKPSELTPHTSKIVSEIISAVFDNAHVAVVEGGVDVAEKLLDQKFDYIFFTGSKKVGKIIAEKAAKNLTPITLELGGKSPCVVDNDANLKVAARRIAWAKLLNAGQTCVAPDFLLVHREVKSEFLQKLEEEITRFYGSDIENSPDFPRIINKPNFDRLTGFLNKGNIIFGGKYNVDELYIEPTIIDDVTWEDDIMQEEIFGPILPVIEFTDYKDIINDINQRPAPLSFYYFSGNRKRQKEMMNSVKYGNGSVNDAVVQFVNHHLPFGGVGASGFGAYHGKASFDAFTYPKSIIRKATWIDIKLRYAPYKNKIGLMKWFLR